MSVTSQIVLASACVTSLGIIGYVHYKQQLDRKQMHEGVVKDMERQQRRKAENMYVLQQQIDFTKEMRKTQYDDDNSDIS